MHFRNRSHQTSAFPHGYATIAWLVHAAILLFGALTIFSHFPTLAESLYFRHIYSGVDKALSAFAAVFPFSLSEISLYGAILFALFWIFRGFRRRRIGRTLLELLAAITFLLWWFYFAWGFNYLRPRLGAQLHLAEIAPDSLRLRENFLWSIEKANAAWQPVAPWNLPELDAEIERNYVAVFTALNMPRLNGHWPPKFLLMPALLDYTLTSGIFGPFFHEVHLNSHLLPVEMPFVLAHEKAHGRGFARESEASFWALLVCLHSSKPALRYSAYFALLGHFMNRYRGFADADSLEKLIRPEIMADFETVRQRIEKYMGPLAEFSHKSYDIYLRMNKVESGMENYTDMVDLVMRWRATHKLE